jgi:hypothetical protein
MPVPLAIAAFCITTAVCHERKRKVGVDQFVSQPGSGLFIRNQPSSFTVGAINMSQFIESSLAGLPSVKSVSVKSAHNRFQVEVSVDDFDWKNLQRIYDKELDLSYVFQGQSIDFRVIDESRHAGQTADAI